MRRAGALLLLLTLAGKSAIPAELTPVLREHTIGAHLAGIAWPETFPKDLVSGLKVTLLVHVALSFGSKQLDQKTAVIVIQYDLWEETFALTMTVGETPILSRSHETRPEIDAFLANLELPDLFAANEMPKDGLATLEAQVLLNPIERERLEAIRKWVLENNTAIPADTSGFSDKRIGNSRANAVFNRIFEQYAHGADEAASWRATFSSRPFEIAEAGH